MEEEEWKDREKRNIQEAQAESEAYKRISIIVDVIIIFHFQSKRYPIIAPERLPIYLPFFLLSLSLSLSRAARNIKNRRELNQLFIYLRETHESSWNAFCFCFLNARRVDD